MYRRCRKKENTEKGNAQHANMQKSFFYKNALKILKKIFTKTSQKFENIFKINEK